MNGSRSGRTRIKICGLTTPDAARAAVDAGADAIGLVFAPRSPRCIDAATARAIVDVLPPMVTPVAVFDAANDELDCHLDAAAPAWYQVHGDRDPETLARLAVRRRVIRGFRFAHDAARRWNDDPAISALLVDGSAGGEGTVFDHGALGAMREEITKPLILAGGLSPENVTAAIQTVRPFAVDVSSGVESAPGVKDVGLMRAFCDAVRRCH